jgi:Dullard-like phosphatase family protein
MQASPDVAAAAAALSMQLGGSAAAVSRGASSAATAGMGAAWHRLASLLQLQLSALALLIAAVWARVAHTASALLAHLSSILSQQAAAASSSAGSSNPQLLQAAEAGALPAAPSWRSSRRRRSPPAQWPQPPASTSGSSGQQQAAAPAVAPAAVLRVPRQLPEHAGRLTIALDLDETLLFTMRALATPDAPRDGGASWLGSSGSSGSPLLALASLLKARSSSGGGGAGPQADAARASGSYTISRRGTMQLPGMVGVNAWMHYTPPAAGAGATAGGAAGVPDGKAQHTLAVFERPGCREFLARLSAFAEVVLFTAAAPEYASPLADLLDPHQRLFRGRLYGDACRPLAGRRHVKDLAVLGRDEARMVLVDNCLFSFLAQPANGLPCLPFRGCPADSQLLGVILPLLRSLSQVGGDIRPLLDTMFNVRAWLASKGYSSCAATQAGQDSVGSTAAAAASPAQHQPQRHAQARRRSSSSGGSSTARDARE